MTTDSEELGRRPGGDTSIAASMTFRKPRNAISPRSANDQPKMAATAADMLLHGLEAGLTARNRGSPSH